VTLVTISKRVLGAKSAISLPVVLVSALCSVSFSQSCSSAIEESEVNTPQRALSEQPSQEQVSEEWVQLPYRIHFGDGTKLRDDEARRNLDESVEALVTRYDEQGDCAAGNTNDGWTSIDGSWTLCLLTLRVEGHANLRDLDEREYSPPTKERRAAEEELGRGRATVVAMRLGERGFPREKIQIHGFGEPAPLGSDMVLDARTIAESQRVEFTALIRKTRRHERGATPSNRTKIHR